MNRPYRPMLEFHECNNLSFFRLFLFRHTFYYFSFDVICIDITWYWILFMSRQFGNFLFYKLCLIVNIVTFWKGVICLETFVNNENRNKKFCKLKFKHKNHLLENLGIKKITIKNCNFWIFNQACTGWMWLWYIFFLSKIITFGGTFIDRFTLYKALT